jgi:hypothetical protein
VDQDALGVQGKNVSAATDSIQGKEVWSKPLTGGAVAVLLMNARPWPSPDGFGDKGGKATAISCTTEQVLVLSLLLSSATVCNLF